MAFYPARARRIPEVTDKRGEKIFEPKTYCEIGFVLEALRNPGHVQSAASNMALREPASRTPYPALENLRERRTSHLASHERACCSIKMSNCRPHKMGHYERLGFQVLINNQGADLELQARLQYVGQAATDIEASYRAELPIGSPRQ